MEEGCYSFIVQTTFLMFFSQPGPLLPSYFLLDRAYIMDLSFDASRLSNLGSLTPFESLLLLLKKE